MVTMRFDWRDIFRSARLAFSFQRLWIQYVGMLLGYLVYVVLTYLSLILAGHNFSVFWAKYGLVPCVTGTPLPWYSWIVYIAGVVVLVYAWMVTALAVARAAYMNLKGNTFYTWKEAFNFALKRKGGSVISTPVAIAFIIFFTALGGIVVGLMGRIPYVGEVGISLFAIIWFMASLFLVFVILALAVSFLLTPAILATTDDDAFEGIFQSFSVMYTQPWRLILYELLLGIVSILGLGIFAIFAKKAWALMTTLFIWGMGDKYADLSYAASYLLQSWINPLWMWVKSIIGVGYSSYTSLFFFSQDFIDYGLSPVTTVSAWIFAIFLICIGGFIISYPFTIFNVGQSIVFMILKKVKDDENLLERKDREEEIEEEEKQEEVPEPEPKKKKPKQAVKKTTSTRKKKEKK